MIATNAKIRSGFKLFFVSLRRSAPALLFLLPACGGFQTGSTPAHAPTQRTWSISTGLWLADHNPITYTLQTADGGLVVFGSLSDSGADYDDLWALKLDSLGAREWETTFGGANKDTLRNFSATADGGFILIGASSSFNSGNDDIWIIKLDPLGAREWERFFGGDGPEGTTDIQPTADGGYVALGMTASLGAGSVDLWLIKTDSQGQEQWSKTLGSPNMDFSNALLQTEDGGYLIGGMKGIGAGFGFFDGWVMKLDAGGNAVWDIIIDESDSDRIVAIYPDTDGGYSVVGESEIFGVQGYSISWLARLSGDGGLEWKVRLNSEGGYLVNSAQKTSDGGFIIAGTRRDPETRELNFNARKLDRNAALIWEQTLPGSFDASSPLAIQTAAGGFIIGATEFTAGVDGYQIVLVSISSDGQIQWNRSFSFSGTDEFYSVLQTDDGGYLATGWSLESDLAHKRLRLLKLDSQGQCSGSGCP